jgi:hypothetical protein
MAAHPPCAGIKYAVGAAAAATWPQKQQQLQKQRHQVLENAVHDHQAGRTSPQREGSDCIKQPQWHDSFQVPSFPWGCATGSRQQTHSSVLPQQQQQHLLAGVFEAARHCSTAASILQTATSEVQQSQSQRLPGQTTAQHNPPNHHQQQQSLEGARVLDGKAIAADWSEQLQQQVPGVRQALGRAPGLAVVLVGGRPDSMLYVSKKEEACMRIGINCR